MLITCNVKYIRMNKLIVIYKALIGIILLSTNAIMADDSGWVVRNAEIMGTTIHTEVWHEDNTLAQEVVDLVLHTMHEVNQSMSPYIENSELSIINNLAASEVISISQSLYDVIARSLYYSDVTQGAFDITFASVGYLYDYRNHKRPSKTVINEQLVGVNYHHIVLDESNNTIHFKQPQVRIDLGGIAKGYAVDVAVERARMRGIDHILVTAGGDTRILGDRHGRPWVIGIRHPLNKKKVIAKIPLVNEALSTSGDYERYFDEDGVRYHHIIDPKTGDSARKVHSVTILGNNAMDTDALSTSVFVLGAKKGLELLESMPNIEGIIVDSDANLLFSSGLQNVE